MSNVVVPNFVPFTSADAFSGIWKQTRAMLAAGWKYKASGDPTVNTKDTTGNPQQDRWAVGGGVNLTQVGAQTGTPTSQTAASLGVTTVSGVTGFVANSVGRYLTIANATNAANNGTFRITAQAGTTVTIFNPSAVIETFPGTATWKEQQGGSSASIATVSTGGAIVGRAIVSGLTGMVAPTTTPLNRGSVGDYLTIINATTGANNGSFRITRVVSASSVEIDNSAAVSDANNGNIIWVESSPLSQTYGLHLQPGNGLGSWICLQGPSTMKIPIGTNVPTGTFLRGEGVTQSSSGATGSILGVVTDTGGGTGFLVIQPWVNGTDGGARGWTTGGTDTVTGATSGATVTSSNAAPIEYVREVVYWKNTNLTGHAWIQCIDQSAESASRFSVIAAGGTATATIAPGGATGAFPTPGSWVFLGTGGSNAAGTGSNSWHANNTTTTAIGFHQIMCANCIEGANVDADGTYITAVGTPASGFAAYYTSFFMRMDDSEDGDVDPYITLCQPSGGQYNATGSTRTTMTSLIGSSDVFTMANFVNVNYTPYKGFRRRGFASGDAYQEFQGACLNNGTPGNTQTPAVTANVASPDRVATQINTQVLCREPIWVLSALTNFKMRKGTMRHLFLTSPGGVGNQTWNNATYIQLSSAFGAVVCDIWDGLTSPSNA